MLNPKRFQGHLFAAEIKNALQFWIIRIFGPLYRRAFKSDVAFMMTEHAIILPFFINVKRHLGITIHFVKPEDDFSKYRKIIVPNGFWPSVQPAASRIPEHKKVYCEIGFLPQTKNVYFDEKGVHGRCSLRDSLLRPLSGIANVSTGVL